MQTSQIWTVPALAIIFALAIAPVYLLVRLWRQRARLTSEERAEIAGAPMTRLQKSAWWGLASAVGTLAITATLLNIYGVDAYWSNDGFRLGVMGIFVAGLVACAISLAVAAGTGGKTTGFDERDRKVLAGAGTWQTAFIIITMAAWLISMGETFHDTHLVPMVYLYLMFGSVILINFVGQFAGVLIGYKLGERFGQA